MKVIILSTYDYEGGAARAAYRLNNALNSEYSDVSSTLFVQKRTIRSKKIISEDSNIGKLMALLRPHIDKIPLSVVRNKTRELISSNWKNNQTLVDKINASKPDIVNVHWINKGFLSITDFHRIKAPIVFTLHDSWLFTGGCHLPGECQKFKEGCSKCPKLDYKSTLLDPVQWNAERKQKEFNRSNYQFVAVSHWMKSRIEESSILRGKPVRVIPNTLDCSVFKRLDKKNCRNILNIIDDKKINVCFGAMSALEDLNKGSDLLLRALEILPSEKYRLLIFGASNSDGDFFRSVPHEVQLLGEINDERMMAIVYNAADIFVMPSRTESFGQTASESMACGTPVCAFGTSGLLDIIDHKINGYLANPYDVKDLVEGIKWLENNDHEELSEKCVAKVERKFSFSSVVEKYVELYNQAIQG